MLIEEGTIATKRNEFNADPTIKAAGCTLPERFNEQVVPHNAVEQLYETLKTN